MNETPMAARSPIRVLILEDNVYDAELMVDALAQSGLDFQSERVDTAAQFTARIERDVDLILSDFTLPQFTGLAALQLVRGRGMDTPFILVSGTIGEDIAVAAMRAGADDYLLKDRMARLGTASIQALEKRSLRHESARNELARRESDARFRQITESIREVFWLTDIAKNEMLYVSPSYELVWGRPCDALYASPQSWIDSIHPQDRDQVQRAAVQDQMKGSYDLEYRVIRPDGSERWIHDRAFPVTNDVGEIHRVAGVAEDITEQKLANLKINSLNRVHAILSGVNALIVRAQDRRTLFDEACRIAVEHGKFSIAWIGEADAEAGTIVPVASAGDGVSSLLRHVSWRVTGPPPGGTLSCALRERRPVACNDIAAEPDVGGDLRREAIRRGYRSVIVLPLVTEGGVAGVFSMFTPEPGQFDDEEVSLLAELAGNIAFAMEHMTRQIKIEKLSRVRAVSSEINAAIVRIQDRETLLKETCRIAAERGKFEFIWLGGVDAAQGLVRPIASVGFTEEAVRAVTWESIVRVNGAFREAIDTCKLVVRNNLSAHVTSGGLRAEAVSAGCLSTVAMPFVEDDAMVGLIALFARGRDFFDNDELMLLNELAADVSFALTSLAHRARVTYLSHYDVLTGLPNRTLFGERLAQEIRNRGSEPSPVALAVLTIERFHNINETFGRHGADVLLKLIADRLANALQGNDRLARIGADSFGVLLTGIGKSAALMHALESQVFACFRQSYRIDEREVIIPVKLGVAVYPQDADGAEALLNNAEAALKEARGSSEQCVFYAKDMNAQAAKYLLLETKLRKALDARQYVLHYQPKIDLANGRLCGMEALIRWQDPESGLVPPAVFIPLLEEIGLIDEVGRWALHQALSDHQAWKALDHAPPRIAVNVSTLQLGRRDFVDYVAQAIRDNGNDPEVLEIEVTESLLIDLRASLRTLFVLRGMGIHIAMDDFGTGYSSLSYLTRLPVSSVKIDRSFVNAMESSAQDMSIVTTIIALARTLNLSVVAEGVETVEQLALLRRLGCAEAQGYLLGRPVPAEQIVERLAHARPGNPWPGFDWAAEAFNVADRGAYAARS